MSTDEEKATAFKNEGNKAFAAHDWPTAISFYTKAIELNDKEPTYYSNRAQVRPRLTVPLYLPPCIDRVTHHGVLLCRPTSSRRHMDMP